MATVRAQDFKDHHHRHTRAISWIVAPLFLAEGPCEVASLWLGWRTEPWGQVASVDLFTANSMLAFLWFVPAHTRLAGGRDEVLLRRLVRMNGWRTGLSSLRVRAGGGVTGSRSVGRDEGASLALASEHELVAFGVFAHREVGRLAVFPLRFAVAFAPGGDDFGVPGDYCGRT